MQAGSRLVNVAIVLRGVSVDPDKISTLLGVTSSKSRKTGELVSPSSTFKARGGIWKLASKVESKLISDHVEELLRQLSSAKVPLNKIEGVEDAFLYVYIGLDEDDDEAVEFDILNSQIAEMSRLGLSLWVVMA